MAAPDPQDFHQPIPLPVAAPHAPQDSASAGTSEDTARAEVLDRPRSKFTAIAFLTSVVLSGTWMGAVGAFLLGYFRSRGSMTLDMQEAAIFVVATFVPPLLFMAVSWVLIRGQAMGEAAEIFAEATEQLFSADETASRTAIRIGRAVRRELDALNAGLDTAFGRMRALENLLQTQVEALDKAGGRVEAHGTSLADNLTGQCRQIDEATATMAQTAAKAGETMAERASFLKATIEAAENALTAAGGSLESQTARFRQAAAEAAEAPHAAAVELDKQVKKIETVADAAIARSEFVLGRQERQRLAMTEMLSHLKEQGLAFETALSAEREAMEHMLAGLDGEAKKFDLVVAEAQKRLDTLMAAAAARTAQMAQTYAREAVHLKETGEGVAQAMTGASADLQKAGAEAQALIGQTSAKARAEADAMADAAVVDAAKLLETAERVAAQTRAMRADLAGAVQDIERHMAGLPAAAKTEAEKIRETVRRETDEMLDLSARTISTLHAKATPKSVLTLDKPEPRQEEAAGLTFLKRRLMTAKPKPKADKGWQMSALLAAAEAAKETAPEPRHPEDRRGDHRDLRAAHPARAAKPSAATALTMLQETLSDMAIDLDAIAGDGGPSLSEWRRYLEGDHGVFARKLAGAIDGETVHRIAMFYRENATFRGAADAYMEEFEGLLAEARQGGSSLLATTLLSSDTGKIYLAISYALGRM